jgi:transposase-like protein
VSATIDFYLSNTRNIGAATIFLKTALRATAASHPPESIPTDKNPTYQRDHTDQRGSRSRAADKAPGRQIPE